MTDEEKKEYEENKKLIDEEIRQLIEYFDIKY